MKRKTDLISSLNKDSSKHMLVSQRADSQWEVVTFVFHSEIYIVYRLFSSSHPPPISSE